MNVYEALDQLHEQGKTYSGKYLYQRHFVHHKPHMDWPVIKPGPLLLKDSKQPYETYYSLMKQNAVLPKL
jgi:hypothetical protein